jgi:hypothetical protein
MTINSGDDSPEASASLANVHPQLYHYTGRASLALIVATNSLWATYFEHLNDATEFQHMCGPLGLHLPDRLIPKIEALAHSSAAFKAAVQRAGGVRPGAERVTQILIKHLYGLTFGRPEKERDQNSFVSCFCSHASDQDYERENGLLSMWRGYAADGGYCLVFDTKRFEELIEEERAAYLYWHIGLAQTHYYKDRTSLPRAFDDLVEASNDVLAAAMSGQDFDAEPLFIPFVTAATSIKHRGFQEEREVRLVAMPATKQSDDKMKGRPGYVSKFIKNISDRDSYGRRKKHISPFGHERSKLPLVKVIVGPARDQKGNAAAAQKIVGKNIPVVLSETPFVS